MKLSRTVLRRVWRFAAPYRAPHRLPRRHRGRVAAQPRSAAAVPADHRRGHPERRPRPAHRAGGPHRAGRRSPTPLLALVERYLSSRIGEGLIFDLRVALFDHVQRMPIAFFTRTQTGALTSRLNNDVIGAQRAVTGTLGSVVSNVVDAASPTSPPWSSSSGASRCIALVLLPLFIVPGQAGRPAPAGAHPPADGPQRVDEHDDDRALQRVRRAAGEAVRPADDEETDDFAGAGRRRARRRRAVRGVRPHLLRRPRPGRRAGRRRRLLGRRAAGHLRRRSRSARSSRWPPSSAASTARSPRSPTPGSTS